MIKRYLYKVSFMCLFGNHARINTWMLPKFDQKHIKFKKYIFKKKECNFEVSSRLNEDDPKT